MGSTSELALVACVLKPLKLGPESSIRGVGISLSTDLSSTTRLSQICWVHKGGCVKYGEGVRDVLRVEVAIERPRGKPLRLGPETNIRGVDISPSTDLLSTPCLSQTCWVHKCGCVEDGEEVRDVLRVEVAIKQPRGVGIESSEASLWSLDVSTQRVNAYPGKPAASRVGEGSGVRHPRFKLGNLRSVLHQNTRVAMMPS
mmetsp:Transcript_38027/g.67041  ORF Transcript_38027/g.67041 Transcript_38027/m.67041 type:complete len:200 (+) Transcript_38027:92-691(+)